MMGVKSSAARRRPPQTQVIDLTIDHVEHIDLTLDDSPPSSPRALNPSSEPPRKRQRLGKDVSYQSSARSLAPCLKAQIKPYIDAYLSDIDSDRVNTLELGRKVLLRISSDDAFQLEFNSTKGFISATLENKLAELARRLVSKYASEPEFQRNASTLNPTSTSAISPAFGAQNFTSSTPTPAPASTTPAWLRPSPATTTAGPVSAPASTSRRLSATPKSKSHRPSPAKFPTSPTTDRTRVQPRWKSWKETKPKPGPVTARHKAINSYMQLAKWPYIPTEVREAIVKGSTRLLHPSDATSAAEGPIPFHVDFNPDEIEAVRRKIREMCGKKPRIKRSPNTVKELRKMLRHRPELLTVIGPEIELQGALARRDQVAIRNLLDELVDRHKRPAQVPKVLTVEVTEADKSTELKQRSSPVSSLLLAREFDGNRGFGRMRRQVNFTIEFRKALEDEMEMRAEWVNCAGDIMTIAWTSNNNFICGTTTHSDSHNQQYNKDGNLLFYSSQSKELKAYPDHRIPRPIIQSGENSTEAMRESQSPWLYSSVVASDYDKVNDRAYTASFDKTVKIWKVDADGRNMNALGTWQHDGVVQFVVASKHESGMVATGADVASQAVRVYHIDEYGSVSGSPFHAYSNLRAWNEGDEQTSATQKWAYYPATMQWGLAEGVKHLLLVGYSPRSFSGDDNDIPEDKEKTGEICLWNCLTGERIRVQTASTQNVFEVAWHPTQPAFIVATSPCPPCQPGTHTQVRVFGLKLEDGEEQFVQTQCLDCPATDINELIIKPITHNSSYVTAACTDGKVYVWDTARHIPIHVLKHQAPIDNEDEDIGVKFTAWGTSADRFYTGGSDGKVRIWNVRDLQKPFIRDLVEAPGCVTSGAFSPDFSKLVIGDASGRVMLLSLDEEDSPKFAMPPMPPGVRPRVSRPFGRPLAFKPHNEPPPPPGTDVVDTASGIARANHFLATGQLVQHPDPTVGVLQGSAYSELGLYRNELHFNGDPSEPLLAKVEESQQENQKMFKRSSRVPRIRPASSFVFADLLNRHQQNVSRNLDLVLLDEYTKLDLLMDKVDLEDPIDGKWDFDYEEE
ncbi:hypothetical protein CkaCkLH20_03995 [Colletotrichum karsti]|uniref:Rik1-associated factor 1 n=1 Tax=Colletotrichum karsti TaxID=1095194 RepID=A0A9P6LM62_9PEZI|nr:uncharacterized protein CkaCkLH20_03995 [Colletotrichum karsti]KAF9878503.1 hypothetical protein CkaCkLH20_03995 [Colletotrichum karsti]